MHNTSPVQQGHARGSMGCKVASAPPHKAANAPGLWLHRQRFSHVPVVSSKNYDFMFKNTLAKRQMEPVLS